MGLFRRKKQDNLSRNLSIMYFQAYVNDIHVARNQEEVDIATALYEQRKRSIS